MQEILPLFVEMSFLQFELTDLLSLSLSFHGDGDDQPGERRAREKEDEGGQEKK